MSSMLVVALHPVYLEQHGVKWCFRVLLEKSSRIFTLRDWQLTSIRSYDIQVTKVSRSARSPHVVDNLVDCSVQVVPVQLY